MGTLLPIPLAARTAPPTEAARSGAVPVARPRPSTSDEDLGRASLTRAEPSPVDPFSDLTFFSLTFQERWRW